ISLTMDRADATPGGVIDAIWAGNPMPSSQDYLRLYALGSAGDEYNDPLIYWPTPYAGTGELLLLVPDVPIGPYELRLMSTDPNSGLVGPVARSEPFRIR